MQKLHFQSLLANLAITEVGTETNQETEDGSRTSRTQSSEETSARSIEIHNTPKEEHSLGNIKKLRYHEYFGTPTAVKTQVSKFKTISN
jgi:hypothetical protein